MQRVALYIRVSTEEQALHGLSVEAQTEALDLWAKNSKVKVIDHYIDAGISARKKASKRPDLQRLLADVCAEKIDLVVFTKLDRWFRNIAEYYKVQEILDDHKVAWKAIHGPREHRAQRQTNQRVLCPASPQKVRSKQIVRHPDHRQHTAFGDYAGQHGGRRGWCHGMGRGQPRLHGHHARLCAKPNHHHQKRNQQQRPMLRRQTQIQRSAAGKALIG